MTAAAVEDSPGAALAERILKVLLRPLLTHHELETFFHTEAPFCIPWKDVAQLCDYVSSSLGAVPRCSSRLDRGLLAGSSCLVSLVALRRSPIFCATKTWS